MIAFDKLNKLLAKHSMDIEALRVMYTDVKKDLNMALDAIEELKKGNSIIVEETDSMPELEEDIDVSIDNTHSTVVKKKGRAKKTT